MRTTVVAALAATAFAATREEMVFMKENGEEDTAPIGMLKVTKEELANMQEAQANSNSPLQIENLGVGTAPLTSGVSVWVDLHEGEWRGVPSWMRHQLEMVVTSSVVTDELPFFFQCLPETSATCDLYAFAYPCLDCPNFEHGNFVKNLVADGWEVFRCTPSVEFVNKPGFLHQMVGLRKTVDAGTKLMQYLEEPSEFFSFGIDYNPQVCDLINDETACSQTQDKCHWDNGECVFNTCKPGGLYGPGFCTTHCITEDVPTIRLETSTS